MDMRLFVELVNYWLDDLTDISSKIGYMESSYEVGGIESVLSGLDEEKKNLERLRKKIGKLLIEMFEQYQEGK